MRINTKKRQSGIELLRIICILCIIAHHYTVHGGFGSFSCETLTGNAVFLQVFSMFGRMPCSVFAIITGYFMINARTEYADHVKKVIPLIAEMVFYSLLFLGVVWIFRLTPVSAVKAVKAFFPFFWDNWFIVYYIILFLMIPFLNPLLLSLTKRNFEYLILLLLVIWSVVPTFAINSWSFSGIDFFVVFYFIGAYIRLHYRDTFRAGKCWLLFGACSILMAATVFVFDWVGQIIGADMLIEHATYFREFSSILAVPCAVFMFLAFRKLNINSNTVNSIASHVLGIYLIHDNTFLREIIWQKISPNSLFLESRWLFAHAVIKVLIVFFACLLIDIVREATFGKLTKKWISSETFSSLSGSVKRRVDVLLKVEETQ